MKTVPKTVSVVLRCAVGAAAVTVLAACAATNTSSTPPATSPTGPASSGTSASTPPASTVPVAARPTSCSVVTKAEAGAALGGQSVKSPVLGHATVEGGIACVFYGPAVPAGSSADVPVGDSVRVVLVTGSNAKKWFYNYRGKVKAQTLTGFGDAAYYDGYASISVLKGDAYLRIAVVIANPLAAEETLARDALPRM